MKPIAKFKWIITLLFVGVSAQSLFAQVLH